MAIGQDTPIDSRISLTRPIPGQSLTSDPDSPWPWEKPPEYTNFTDATNYLVSLLIQEKNYLPIMDTIADGTPLMDLTQGILFKGFMEGKWNPDLMMLLAERLCYMLLAFCERADIDPVIYSEEDDDLADEATLFINKNFKILMHCFTGSKEFAKKLLDIGSYFSASGIITFKKNYELVETFKYIPNHI